MNDASKAYIITHSGTQFFLLDPHPDMIKIEDIAHALSNQCRWTGHSKFHYSVAQHAVYCSYLGPLDEAFERLNHDDSEAYIGDMNRPLKHYTDAGAAYRRVEHPLQTLIYQKYGMSEIEPPSVKKADEAMLYAEMEQLLPTPTFDVGSNNPHGLSKAAKVRIVEWTPKEARDAFLERFYELQAKRNNSEHSTVSLHHRIV